MTNYWLDQLTCVLIEIGFIILVLGFAIYARRFYRWFRRVIF